MSTPPQIQFTVEPHGAFERLLWTKTNGDKGFMWVKPEDGFLWVIDARNAIAAADEWRIQQYFTNGIRTRLIKLVDGYLREMIPLREGMLTINFGANIGEVAIVMSHYGKVIAIEPDPKVLPALWENAHDRSIEVVAAAAWHVDGPITLYQKPKTADSSVIDMVGPGVTVAGMTLDTIFGGLPGGTIADLLLGDAEGAEPEVLQGATETLKRTRYVSIRVGPERHGQSSAPLVRPILEAAGFEILFDAEETIIGRNRALHEVAHG